MILSAQFRHLRKAAIGLALRVMLPLVAGGALHAENLVSVRNGELPALPRGTAIDALFATDAPGAVRSGTVWHYDETTGAWRESNPQLEGAVIHGVIAAGSRAWLLAGPVGSGLIDRLQARGPDAAKPTIDLPSFPVPLVTACGAVLGNILHVAGVDGKGLAHWWSLDLAAAGASWKILTPWAGRAEGISSLVAQDAILVLTTSSGAEGADELWRWHLAEGWKPARRLAGAVVAGAARPLGQAHVLYLLRLPAGAAESRHLQLVTYHTTTTSIATQGEPREGDARLGAGWRNGLIWIDQNGNFRTAEIEGSKQLLRPFDWVMIAFYFALIGGIGYWCYRQEKKQSTAAFFVGSRSIPFWAAGISL